MPTYTFDIDAQGWTSFGGATFTHEAGDGNPGGHIRGVEALGGTLWYFRTPETLRGDLTSYFGGSIAFDLRQDYSNGQLDGDDLVIEGGGIRLIANFANPAMTWTPYYFDIEVGSFYFGAGNGRIATREEILTVLGNVTRFDIRGEYRNGTDAAELDNFVLAEGAAEPAPTPGTIIRSSFDTGREDWTFANDVQQFRHVATGGAPHGYLEAVDAAIGQLWYFVAPARFLGDQRQMFGGALSFDLRQSTNSNLSPEIADLILIGGGIELHLNFPNQPGQDWTHYSAALNGSAGWRIGGSGTLATDAQIAAVLAGLTGIHVRGEFYSGADTGGLDNFTLQAPDGTIVGTFAAETLLGSAAADRIFGFGDADNLQGRDGNDRLDGGDGNDFLYGQNGHDLLDGGAGADMLYGGQGEDIYWVDDAGDRVFELDGQGSDLVNSSVTFSLAGQFVEVLNLVGSAAINGTGNGLANRMVGNAAANVLFGMDGNDRLDGGAGADRMRGSLGNDVYVVDDVNDALEEFDGQGTDTVEASIGYSLVGRFVELLVLTGSADINGTGNGLVNTLIGNSGANLLNGMGGADSMRGGVGNDRYVVDHAADAVIEADGEGYDIIESSVSFSLAGQYAEELRLTGTAGINATGSGLANTLIGNAGTNLLRGEGGNDVLKGGLGADTLLGGAGMDQFWFDTALGSGNIEAIGDFVVADDSIYLSRTIFAGIAANGTLAAAAFRLGTAALDADDRIVYDAATGNIWYDADGTGDIAATLFATVTAGLALTRADFVAVA